MDDSTVIDLHGGASTLARLLGYDLEAGGVQRVHNWRARGIPPRVKLDRPDLFGEAVLRELADRKDSTSKAA